jgi:hypothetical protein
MTLDEATANIDSETEAVIQASLAKMYEHFDDDYRRSPPVDDSALQQNLSYAERGDCRVRQSPATIKEERFIFQSLSASVRASRNSITAIYDA